MITDRRKQALIEMAKRGTASERKIAESIIEKSGISIEDESTNSIDFKYKTKHEKQLLFQIFAMVTNTIEGNHYTYKNKKNMVGFYLTKIQESEMNLFYGIYKRELELEMKLTFSAFIQKNAIFPQSDIDDESKKYTPEEIQEMKKVLSRANNMDKTQIRKQIEIS